MTHDCRCEECQRHFIGMDMKHKFNYHGAEQIDPNTGYGERNVEWFKNNIWPDLIDTKERLKLGPSLIDIGCASGYMTKEYYKLFSPVTGVDFSHVRIEQAEEYNPGPRYIQFDLVHGNYEDLLRRNSGYELWYDTAISSAVFQHISPLDGDRVNAFTNTRAVLKDGGYLICYDEDYETRPDNFDGFYTPLAVPWLKENLKHIFELESRTFVCRGGHNEFIYRYMLRAI